MKKKICLMTVIIFFLFSSITFAVEVAPRITDREIIQGLTELKGDIKRVEEKIEKVDEGQKELKGELKEFILWGFGVIFSGIFALIGFVLWDRRTALAPAIQKAKELEEREERLEKILKEIALKDANVAEALRHAGLV